MGHRLQKLEANRRILALSRSFFPKEAQLGETVPTQSLVISQAQFLEERVFLAQRH